MKQVPVLVYPFMLILFKYSIPLFQSYNSQAIPYVICADETTDVSIIEQLSLCARFELTKTSKNIADSILACTKQWGLTRSMLPRG
jgi:hypothetical protein